jgi:hypothetical protein
MTLIVSKTDDSNGRLSEIRRFQVYRLERARRRPLLQRLRRTLLARLHR